MGVREGAEKSGGRGGFIGAKVFYHKYGRTLRGRGRKVMTGLAEQGELRLAELKGGTGSQKNQ